MYIDPSWNYKKIVKNIRTLKHSFEERLTSFYYLTDEIDYIRDTRDSLYALHIEEFQKDRIWEYMNGYLSPFEIFIYFGFKEDKSETSNTFDG